MICPVSSSRSCNSFYFYIKPQLRTDDGNVKDVVIHSISTSNHNSELTTETLRTLYFILFLHQTTTDGCKELLPLCCNSFYFYIKPQLPIAMRLLPTRCNSFYFYIKPQLKPILIDNPYVVIHSISTSNHNKLE